MELRLNPTFFRLLIAGLVILILGWIGWSAMSTSGPGKHPSIATNPSAGSPPRIVALSPALAIILRDLELQDCIVGRHAYDMILDKSVPVCGDQSGLDYERLIAAHPTHILMQWSEREIPNTLKTIAAERNWRLINAPTLTLDDIRRTVKQLAAEFAAVHLDTRQPKTDLTATDPQVLNAYLRVEDRLAKAWPTDSKPSGPRILMLESLDPPAALGPGSFHHELLLAVGGQPAITSGKPYVTLDAEDVLRLAPEAIVIFAPRPYGSSPRPELSQAELLALLNRLGTLNIPAIRDRRIALIDDPLCLLPSTAMVDLADELRRRLAAWKQP